jgi:dihydrolipoamide dehydrogenase
MTTKTFDAVVIGAGPGGYVAAIRLAQLGKKTALVEKESLGGGILVSEPRVDIAKLRAFKEGVVKKLVGGVGALEKGNGVEVLKGTATFVGPNAVEVEAGGEKTRVEAGAFILATGARPIAIPGFAYGKDVWTAREALDLPEVPARLVVIGGGVIGLELGTVYAKLGSKVTVVEALPALLTGVDPEAVRIVQKGLRQRGVDVHLNAKARGLDAAGGALSVRIEVEGKEQAIPADKVLVAVGFRPNTEGLGLDTAGVKLDARGYVQVDDQLRSSNPAVFAIGDVVGPPFLAHKASKEGEIAAEVVAGRKSARDWVAMPGAIFTDPEVATTGLSEEQARAKGLDPIVGKFAFAALGRAIAIDHTEGFVKVIADRESKILLGVTMVGPEASDLIAEATLALEMGAYVEDVALTIHAHPTLAEAFMEASKAALGEAIHAINRPERPRREKAEPAAKG